MPEPSSCQRLHAHLTEDVCPCGLTQALNLHPRGLLLRCLSCQHVLDRQAILLLLPCHGGRHIPYRRWKTVPQRLRILAGRSDPHDLPLIEPPTAFVEAHQNLRAMLPPRLVDGASPHRLHDPWSRTAEDGKTEGQRGTERGPAREGGREREEEKRREEKRREPGSSFQSPFTRTRTTSPFASVAADVRAV